MEYFKQFDNFLYEGLIKTYPNHNVTRILDSFLQKRNKKFHPSNINIIQDILFIRFGKIFDDPKSIELIEDTVKLCNTLGYFPSQFSYFAVALSSPEKWNWDKVKEIINVYEEDIVNFQIRFEKKFDKTDETPYVELFHITKKSNLPKILKYGLIPKSKGKLSEHPERIYLSINDDINHLHIKFKDIDIGEYVLLSIKPVNLKLYKDPNYPTGLYTYQNIHPKHIKIEKYL